MLNPSLCLPVKSHLKYEMHRVIYAIPHFKWLRNKSIQYLEKLEPPYTLLIGMNAKWFSHFGKQVVLQNRVTIQPNNYAPRVYTLKPIPKKNENTCPKINLYRDVHSSVIHNS